MMTDRRPRREEGSYPWWLAYSFDNPLRRLVHDAEQMFAPYVRKEMTVVDVGCGMGYFSLALARIVGPRGRVHAIDRQRGMLDRVERRAGKAGLDGIIALHRCGEASLNFHETVDFALTFWMVHEVSDPDRLLSEIYVCLNKGGIYFLAEPKIHVSSSKIDALSAAAVSAGFTLHATPKVALSRAFVYEKR